MYMEQMKDDTVITTTSRVNGMISAMLENICAIYHHQQNSGDVFENNFTDIPSSRDSFVIEDLTDVLITLLVLRGITDAKLLKVGKLLAELGSGTIKTKEQLNDLYLIVTAVCSENSK